MLELGTTGSSFRSSVSGPVFVVTRVTCAMLTDLQTRPRTYEVIGGGKVMFFFVEKHLRLIYYWRYHTPFVIPNRHPFCGVSRLEKDAPRDHWRVG